MGFFWDIPGSLESFFGGYTGWFSIDPGFFGVSGYSWWYSIDPGFWDGFFFFYIPTVLGSVFRDIPGGFCIFLEGGIFLVGFHRSWIFGFFWDIPNVFA